MCRPALRKIAEIQTLLGYPGFVEEPDAAKKMKAMCDAAIEFGRLLAVQRAIFKLWEPSKPEKLVEDEYMTNVDNTFEDAEEKTGSVWFMIRPGLVKWGTGKGEQLDSHMVLVKALVELA